MWSAVREASAMIVNVGFFSEAEGKALASTTYRFGTSWDRQNLSNTDVWGVFPMRQPPISEHVAGAELTECICALLDSRMAVHCAFISLCSFQSESDSFQ